MKKKKHDIESAIAVLRAATLADVGATKKTISLIHGNAVANNVEVNQSREHGIKTWINSAKGRNAANVIVSMAVELFDYNPDDPSESLRNMDFNEFLSMFRYLGYDSLDITVNRVAEVLIEPIAVQNIDICTSCGKPHIVSANFEVKCTRCRALSNSSAIARYSRKSTK